MPDLHHLLSWRESSHEFWTQCIERALRFAGGEEPPQLSRHIGMLFMNPSLRTRASMEVAAARLGCRVTSLSAHDAWKLAWDDGVVMDGDSAEHVKDAAAVLSGYFDAIGVRSFEPLPNPQDELSDTPIARIARHCSVPVVNLESAAFHPCQALADAAVLSQQFGPSPTKLRFVLTWAYHPRALPLAVAQSTLLMAARMGSELTLACPPEFALSERIMAEAGLLARQHGGTVSVSHDLNAAATDAHVIYAKSWTPNTVSATPDGGSQLRESYRDWRVTGDLMNRTDRGVFMHCLPVRRNVIVDDDVLDGPTAIVQRQARMRVDANMAILSGLIGRDS